MQYYTFELGGENVGYFEISQAADAIVQKAQFRMGDDEIINIFYLKLSAGQVTAFKYQDEGEWIDMEQYEDDWLPTSAYPLVIERANPTYTYQSIYEGTGEHLAEVVVTRDGDCITETENGNVSRRFWLSNGLVTKIDWGGPISRLVGSKEEAVAGSPYA